jgi:hypothetical protein
MFLQTLNKVTSQECGNIEIVISGSSEQIDIRLITFRLLGSLPRPKKIFGLRTVEDVCDCIFGYVPSRHGTESFQEIDSIARML